MIDPIIMGAIVLINVIGVIDTVICFIYFAFDGNQYGYGYWDAIWDGDMLINFVFRVYVIVIIIEIFIVLSGIIGKTLFGSA